MQRNKPLQEYRGARAARLKAALWVGLIIAAGCARRSVDPVRTDLVQRTDRRIVIPLISHPRKIYKDVLFPRVLSRQTFRWSEGEAEWEIRFPADRDAHAGFTFEEPLDLHHAVESSTLKFKIAPAEAVNHLTAALADAPDENTPPGIVQAALSGYASRTWGGASVSIPFSAFTPPTNDGASMDWTRINEFRLVLREPFYERQSLTVRHLRIQIN